MGRTLKRVPLDFDWQIGRVWSGYLNPHYKACPDCIGGWTAARKWLSGIVHLLMMLDRQVTEDRPLHPWLINLPTRPGQLPSPEIKDLIDGLAGRPSHGIMGHDSIDDIHAEEKIIKAAGLPKKWGICKSCKGNAVDATVWKKWDGWRETEPPKGDGYQLWETVTEGSPISPVFKSIDKLAAWAENNATTFGSNKASAASWKKMLDEDNVHHKEGNMIFL